MKSERLAHLRQLEEELEATRTAAQRAERRAGQLARRTVELELEAARVREEIGEAYRQAREQPDMTRPANPESSP